MLKVFETLQYGLNTMNSGSSSGFTNFRTGVETNAGGMVLGDCFDLDRLTASNLSGGTCFEGRYRVVQVDANANAANVARGKAAFVVPGYGLYAAVVATPGSGQAPGTYQVIGTGGGGSGAVISVLVGAAGTVLTQPLLVSAGSGYTSAPVFTLAAGGTPATFSAQMTFNSYIVTDAGTTGVVTTLPRGVFLNSITPGNYGIIQENGIASFLVDSTAGTAIAGDTLTMVGATLPGSFRTFAKATAPLYWDFGVAIDVAIANGYVRGLMTLPVWNG